MAEAYLGEIRIFAGKNAPKGWAFCNGQLLPISSNTALFSILGTHYGGDGRTNFALPDLQGRAPMNQGRGPGLSARSVGDQIGTSTVELNITQIPAHTHIAQGIGATGDSDDPTGRYWAESKGVGHPHPNQIPYYNGNADTAMSSDSLRSTGGGHLHNNRQPYLAVNFIICMEGVFPPRN